MRMKPIIRYAVVNAKGEQLLSYTERKHADDYLRFQKISNPDLKFRIAKTRESEIRKSTPPIWLDSTNGGIR